MERKAKRDRKNANHRRNEIRRMVRRAFNSGWFYRISEEELKRIIDDFVNEK